MIPKITNGGTSFKGAARYYLHDKGAETRERVAWTHTENLLTNDPDKAWKVMAWTAKEAERLKEASGQKMTGRKLTKPVFAYSLAWHPEENPDREHMLATAKKSVEVLGFDDHEFIVVAHRDEPQRHLHVIINRVHPLTGLAGDTGNSKLKLSDFAREYERERGKIYCLQREENHRKRTNGERTRYRDMKILNAWNNSDNGKGFAAALKDEGYALAQGRKRLVIVDRYGQTINPTRHLENVRAKDLEERLRDLDLLKLPDATELSRGIQATNKRRYFESLKYDEDVARHTNELQDRQLEERSTVSGRYREQLAREQAELSKQYHLDEQKQQIEVLETKAKNSSWWKRVLGITKRQQERLRELELNRQNAEWRLQEKLSQTTKERETSLIQLKAKHEREQRTTVQKLETQKPSDYANQIERDKIAEFLKEKRQERNRQGPTRGR